MLTEREIESILTAGTGHPGDDALTIRARYQSLSAEEQLVAQDILRRWLASDDTQLVSQSLWFIGWVCPVDSLVGDVIQSAEFIDRQVGRGDPTHILPHFLVAVDKMKLPEVAPLLRRWAEACTATSPERRLQGVAAVTCLLSVDRSEALRYVARIAGSDLSHLHDVSHASLEEIMTAYLWRYPQDVAPLGAAVALLQPMLKEYAWISFNRALDMWVSAKMPGVRPDTLRDDFANASGYGGKHDQLGS